MGVRDTSKIKRKRPGQLGLHGGPCQWAESQKVEVVAKWLILGNLAEAARQLKIPDITVRKWKQTDWWKEKEKELRLQANVELEGKLGKVLNKSLEETMDRLDKGDLTYDQKTGKFHRVPVKATVVNQISKTMLDKKIILERMNNKEQTTEEAVFDRLSALKKEFLQFTKARTIEAPKIIDVEVLPNAVI
jgi:hypothetical protein